MLCLSSGKQHQQEQKCHFVIAKYQSVFHLCCLSSTWQVADTSVSVCSGDLSLSSYPLQSSHSPGFIRNHSQQEFKVSSDVVLGHDHQALLAVRASGYVWSIIKLSYACSILGTCLCNVLSPEPFLLVALPGNLDGFWFYFVTSSLSESHSLALSSPLFPSCGLN